MKAELAVLPQQALYITLFLNFVPAKKPLQFN